MTDAAGDRLLTTVVNSFDILEALKDGDGATVAELAASLDISRSTLYDYLTTLYELEYVVKDGEEYDVSLKALDLGSYAREQVPLLAHARGPVAQLASSTDQVAWLFVEEHGRIVYLYSAEGANAIRTRGRVGRRAFMHATAAGKAILAHLSADRVEAIVERHGLPRLTDETITATGTLREELETVRDRGYATNVGESMAKARAVAAPIMSEGTPVGAINVVGAENRLVGRVFEEELPEAVLGAANDIELNLRYR